MTDDVILPKPVRDAIQVRIINRIENAQAKAAIWDFVGGYFSAQGYPVPEPWKARPEAFRESILEMLKENLEGRLVKKGVTDITAEEVVTVIQTAQQVHRQIH